MEQDNKRTFINVLSTVGLQVITLLSGFIIPKLILDAFGSHINGLVTSITQFLSYISLLEGGVGAVILANLYKPLATDDKEKVSAVVATAESFFKKIALFFFAYQVVLAGVYPFFVETALSWGYISSLTLILGLTTFIQYYFALTWRLLLQADKKMFMAAGAQGTAVVLNLLLTVVIIKVFPNIHLVKLAAGIAYFCQPWILNRYVAKHYALNRKAAPDPTLLSQRWDGFGINLAAMVHASTATVVLTVTTGLESVSVFSVYMLVANGLKSLITSISAGVVPTIGNLWAKGDEDGCNRMFDLYDYVMFFLSFLAFCVSAVMVSSFAILYTKGIRDADYYQPLMGGVLMAAECIFCIREPYVNMAYSAGHFRSVSKFAYIEAGLNIALSILLALIWGMTGVAAALLISITYRTLTQVWYVKRNIIKRPMKHFFRKLAAFSAASAVCIWLSLLLGMMDLTRIGVLNWVLYALRTTVLEAICLLAASLIACPGELKLFRQFLRKKT